MNTSIVLNSYSLRAVRYIEIGLYAILAALLIGQIFYFTATISAQNALLVLLGEILGLMVSCAVTPLSAVLDLWLVRGRPVLEKVLVYTAETLPFIRRNRPAGRTDRTESSDDEETRRAA